jgi:putative tryptophan/tyrosine transport system substrate-binding protein
MNRREFIASLGGAAASVPWAAHAQQKAVPVIGLLSPGPPGAGGPLLDGFRQGLSEAGFTEGQNVTIEYHWVEASDRLPAMATDLQRPTARPAFTPERSSAVPGLPICLCCNRSSLNW